MPKNKNNFQATNGTVESNQNSGLKSGIKKTKGKR